MIRTTEQVRIHVSEPYIPDDIETQKDWYWHLRDHPVFKYVWNGHIIDAFDQLVLIELQAVNPDTDEIDDDETRNTRFDTWIEAGPMSRWDEDMDVPPPEGGWTDDNRFTRSHDYRLNVGAQTHWEAMLFLAARVRTLYNDDGSDKGLESCDSGCVQGQEFCPVCGFQVHGSISDTSHSPVPTGLEDLDTFLDGITTRAELVRSADQLDALEAKLSAVGVKQLRVWFIISDELSLTQVLDWAAAFRNSNRLVRTDFQAVVNSSANVTDVEWSAAADVGVAIAPLPLGVKPDFELDDLELSLYHPNASALLGMAGEAIKALDARKDEPVHEWARRLAQGAGGDYYAELRANAVRGTDFDMGKLDGEAYAIAAKVVDLLFKQEALPVARTSKLSNGGCKAFYTPAEWRERKEQYGLSSKLILVHDGGTLARYCNPAYEDDDAIEAMREALAGVGMYVEQCTSWYSAVYPDHDRVHCKFCDTPFSAQEGHIHQGSYVGPCCWDERLVSTQSEE